MDKEQELRPCPFCGSPAEYEQDPFDADKDTPVVQTVGCKNEDCIGYMPRKFFSTKRDARAAWNRRANEAQAEVAGPVAWTWTVVRPGYMDRAWSWGSERPHSHEAIPLYSHPSPAVAGGVTEAPPFETLSDELVGMWAQGLGFAADHRPVVDLAREVEHYRALSVGDEGRETQVTFTEEEIRNELYRREEAGRDARVALTMPARFHPFSSSDLRSMLPPPPAHKGEGE